MRTKKTYIVLSFRTTVEAMAWEKHCATAQIPGRLIPLPREISAGCGLAWRMTPEDWEHWNSLAGPGGLRRGVAGGAMTNRRTFYERIG